MACVIVAYLVMAYIVMAYIAMAHVIVAYIVMAYIVMAQADVDAMRSAMDEQARCHAPYSCVCVRRRAVDSTPI